MAFFARTSWNNKHPLDSQQHVRWLLLVITMIATVLRGIHIGDASLWNDELFSRFYCETGLEFMWTRGFSLETTPPTYYTVLLGWMHLFGTSEAAMRSLSLVASVATIPMVYLIGRELAGVSCGLLAALLFALSPMQIYFAQEARAYALMLLPIAVALLAMAGLLRDPRNGRHFVLYIIGASAAVYTHSTSILLIAAFNLAFLLTLVGNSTAKPRAGLRRWIAANVIIALLCVPEALAIVHEVRANRLSWMNALTARDIAFSAGVLIFGPATYSGRLSIILGFIFFIILSFGTLAVRPDRRAIMILIIVPVIDFALILLAGIRQPILVPRLLCWMWLPLSVLLSYLLLRRSWMRSALGIATTLVLVTGLAFQFGQGAVQKEPWKLLLARLKPQLEQVDIVVTGPWTQPMGLLYYGQGMTNARHWTENLPSTVESTIIARQIGVKDITRDALLSSIREGKRVLLIQRQIDASYQHLLSEVYLPSEQWEENCGDGWCLKAFYWN